MRFLRDLKINGGNGDNIVVLEKSAQVDRDLWIVNGDGDDLVDDLAGIGVQRNVTIAHGDGSSVTRFSESGGFSVGGKMRINRRTGSISWSRMPTSA